jgi:hypothetical protein
MRFAARLFQSDTRFAAIGEFDACFFEGVLDGFDGAEFQFFTGLKSRDRARGDFRQLGKPQHPDPKRCSGHSALRCIYRHIISISS